MQLKAHKNVSETVPRSLKEDEKHTSTGSEVLKMWVWCRLFKMNWMQ